MIALHGPYSAHDASTMDDGARGSCEWLTPVYFANRPSSPAPVPTTKRDALMPRPLKIGVQLPEVEYDYTWSQLRQMARTAEAIGLD